MENFSVWDGLIVSFFRLNGQEFYGEEAASQLQDLILKKFKRKVSFSSLTRRMRALRANGFLVSPKPGSYAYAVSLPLTKELELTARAEGIKTHVEATERALELNRKLYGKGSNYE